MIRDERDRTYPAWGKKSMTAENALLFIDANKYLDLYRLVKGRPILASIGQQAKHIFVTQQVVEEVKRRKVEVTADFLERHFTNLKLQTYPVHEHLFGRSEEDSKKIQSTMKKIGRQVDKLNKDLKELAMTIMDRVSQSADEVSAVLDPIFAKAEPHEERELQRAHDRKERGNPPGKQTDPIGDQLTWEQILSRFVGKRKLWVISGDSDYGTIYEDKGYLNQLLYQELRAISSDAEAFFFRDVSTGIRHFAQTTGVDADKLPTPQEIEEIKEEEKRLPPLDWIYPGLRPITYARPFGGYMDPSLPQGPLMREVSMMIQTGLANGDPPDRVARNVTSVLQTENRLLELIYLDDPSITSAVNFRLQNKRDQTVLGVYSFPR
jgi:hypothetical protein